MCNKSFTLFLTLMLRTTWMLLKFRGGWFSPHLLNHQESLWKKQCFCMFWEFIMNLEKSRNLRPPAPFFHREKDVRKKCGLNQSLRPIRVKSHRIWKRKLTSWLPLENMFLAEDPALKPNMFYLSLLSLRKRIIIEK